MAALLQISDVPFTYYLARQPYFLAAVNPETLARLVALVIGA